MSSRGVVAAGHPVSAEAGAWALREGGNAVDAAVAAVLASFAAESPLTGLGAGGYMLVHDEDETVLLDFFVEVPGRGGRERSSELVPLPIYFTPDVPQTFNVGAASCGVPGTPAGLEEALRRAGSAAIADLVEPGVRAAREGVEVNASQAFVVELLAPVLTIEAAHLYAPGGNLLREGDVFRFPELADALELYAAEGSEPFYRGEVARRIAEWVCGQGGTLGAEDLAAYEPIARDPVRARFRGRDVLTNPPPSSGGLLIAYALELLERMPEVAATEVVEAMAAAQAARTERFTAALYEPGFAERFLDPQGLDAEAARLRGAPLRGSGGGAGDRLGSTTHVTAVDAAGRCASVTCSNGIGSGLFVPGTGVHVNNMLGEEDLNPFGFHRLAPGTRMPSMMSPAVILRDGELEAGLGSAGSNRIRSAIAQTIVRMVVEGLDAQAAVNAPRLHFEAGVVHAEPGIDADSVAGLEARAAAVVGWQELNLYFGGVQAVARDRTTGALSGGGDPRRAGAVAYA